MVGMSTDHNDLEKLVAATKDSYRLPVDINAIGAPAAVAEGRRNILEGIVRAGGQLNAYPAVVATPYLIWTSPLEILIDSHIEPWNNRARVYGVRNNGGDANGYAGYSVGFFYFWDNPSPQNYALVDVASTLVTKGFVSATGNTGIVSGGLASLSASTSLILHQLAGDVPLWPQAGQTEGMYSVEAQGGGVWSGETGRTNTRGVFYEATVEYRFYPVPPGARAIFEVRLTLSTSIRNGSGSVWFDFANAAQDNYVQCPALIVTVLSGL